MQTFRIIFHIDMNCFFASVEMAENNELMGKPIVVARLDPLRKGIILSPNYEARKFGIKTTMQVKDALLLCHNLIVCEPHMQLYEEYSNYFFEYFRSITPYVEPASIDEGYLDVTEVCKTKDALTLAKEIQEYLLNNLQLPCSIGIAPNKFLAKMASDMKKPLGITILRKREIDKLLWPLPIDEMIGIGKKTTPRLIEAGFKTIKDIANVNNLPLLESIVGNQFAQSLYKKAWGIDDSVVNYEYLDDVSSISNSYTFDHNIGNEKVIIGTLNVISNTVSTRLIQKNYKAKTIGIQLKYDDFHTISRSVSVNKPICDEEEMFAIVKSLFYENYDQTKDVRLVGVFANRLIEAKDEIVKYTLFDDLNKIEKDNMVQHLLNNINEKYGEKSIARGYKKEK